MPHPAPAHKQLHGIIPYLVSPIDEATGQVRERVLRELVDHLIAEGVHGLSPLGSTGEFAYLSFEQREEIVRIVVDAAAGRVPVVPGVAAYSTVEAIRQATRFVELGADALVLILQTMFPVSRSGMESYFTLTARAVDCPIVLYTNPGLLGGDVTPDIVDTLSHVPNISYVKDASGNTGRILTILNRVGDRMKVFSASAHIPFVVFQLGGVGWMAGPACVVARECVELYDLMRAGRVDEALERQRPLWRVNELFQKYSLAACIKAGLQVKGFAVGGPIPPQEPLRAEAVEEIRAALASLERVTARA
ncbi:MAG: dihydrodipicolinate synthase family protein [Chloroflexota bacterium]